MIEKKLYGGSIGYFGNEIDDSFYSWKIGMKKCYELYRSNSTILLGKLINHRSLFEKYPLLKSNIVIFGNIADEDIYTDSSVSHDKRGYQFSKININLHFNYYKKHGKEKFGLHSDYPEFSRESVLLHEVQHILQQADGRPFGRSYEEIHLGAMQEGDKIGNVDRVKLFADYRYRIQPSEQEAMVNVYFWLKDKKLKYKTKGFIDWDLYNRIMQIKSQEGFYEKGGTLNCCKHIKKMELGGEVKTPHLDKLIGGKADGKSIWDIAIKHNVSVDYAIEQLEKGIEEEMEHTPDFQIRYEIALDHLFENIDYYNRLKAAKLSDGGYLGDTEIKYVWVINDKETGKNRKSPFLSYANALGYLDGIKEVTAHAILYNKKTNKIAAIYANSELKEIMAGGGEITPHKEVSASVQAAIKDVLTLDNYKHITPMEAGMLYNKFKDYDSFEKGYIYDNPVTTYKSDGLEKTMFENLDKKGFVSADKWDETIELSGLGLSFVDAVKNRIETRKAVKTGTDLFPEDAGISELKKYDQIVSEPNKDVDKIENIAMDATKNNAIEVMDGFTEAKDLNKMFSYLKGKYGDKKGGGIYSVVVNSLVNPNKNTIIEIRGNGVVVKEGDKYIFKPFGNTDANVKKWTLYKGIDISEQYLPKKTSTQMDVFVKEIASKSNIKEGSVYSFIKKNSLTDKEVLNLVQGLGMKKIKSADFVAAVVGNPNNEYEKEILRFVKSNEAFKRSTNKEPYDYNNTIKISDVNIIEAKKIGASSMIIRFEWNEGFYLYRYGSNGSAGGIHISKFPTKGELMVLGGTKNEENIYNTWNTDQTTPEGTFLEYSIMKWDKQSLFGGESNEITQKTEKQKTMESKVKMKFIKIRSAEGKTNYVSQFPKEYTSWKAANDALKPLVERGVDGYNKVNLEVHFEDGEKYDSRLYVSEKEDNPYITDNVIGRHIQDYLKYSITKSTNEKDKQNIIDWLNKYDLHTEPIKQKLMESKPKMKKGLSSIAKKKESHITVKEARKLARTVHAKRKPTKRTKGEIALDKKYKAKKAGRRVSASGKVYYEYRENRIDHDQRKKLAKGGSVGGSKIKVYGTDAELQKKYLDWTNNFITLQGFADHYDMSKADAERVIELGKEAHERIVKSKKSDYYISEGHDHKNNKPLYQVNGRDNDYVGEWHTLKTDAEKELKSLTK